MNAGYEIMRNFHITSKYKGYPLMIEAIEISIKNFGKCIQVTKDIYPVLAHRHNISQYSVERNIRTIVETCWKNDRDLVIQILGYEITCCPTNSEFIDSIAYYIKMNDSNYT